jgi:tight adherence protein B
MIWLWVLFAEVVLIALAIRFFSSSRREKDREDVYEAMRASLPQVRTTMADRFDTPAETGFSEWLDELTEGLQPKNLMIGVAVAVGVVLAAFLMRGVVAGLIAVPLVLAVGVLVLQRRIEGRRRAMLQQIPVFNDMVLRSLASGKGVEWAIRQGALEAAEPLRTPMAGVVRTVDAGGGLAQALHNMSVRYRLKELSLFAMAIHISYNYGSNPRQLLENVSNMIRRNDQARRELAALTGETKLTAWVLGLVPVLMVIYLNFSSPNYLGGMLDDPSGRWVLFSGVALQLAGVFTLWRMVRSLN